MGVSMQRAVILFIALSVLVAPAQAARLSDAEVTKAIIQESLSSYSGNCPCPYNTDRRGRSCGRRSAYIRPGGYAPICYSSDVSPAMIERYRKDHSS